MRNWPFLLPHCASTARLALDALLPSPDLVFFLRRGVEAVSSWRARLRALAGVAPSLRERLARGRAGEEDRDIWSLRMSLASSSAIALRALRIGYLGGH